MAATDAALLSEAEERELAEQFARQLLDVARAVDPGATYTLASPIDAGMWVMHLYVRSDLAEEADLKDVMADHTTDILIEHDLGIAAVFHDRKM